MEFGTIERLERRKEIEKAMEAAPRELRDRVIALGLDLMDVDEQKAGLYDAALDLAAAAAKANTKESS